MFAKVLAHVPVHAQIMEEVIPLENGVMLHHPVIGFADKGFQQNRCHVGMVEGAKGIADVMQQGADDVFIVLAVAMGEGGGLQAVLEPVDPEPAEIAFQQPQVRHDPVRQSFAELAKIIGNDLPVLGLAVLHVGEGGAGLCHVVHCGGPQSA